MADEKIHNTSVFFAILIIGVVYYFIHVWFWTEYSVYIIIFWVLIVALISYAVFHSSKDEEFKLKCKRVLHNMLLGLSKWGDELQKGEKGRKSSKKKKRVPVPAHIKDKVYTAAAYKCQICGKKGNLHVHHINGNPSDNKISNLILLCPNDHADADRGSIPKDQLRRATKLQATGGKTKFSKNSR